MDDLGKVAVIAAIMGAILLVGVILAPTERATVVQEPVAVGEPIVEEVTILQEDSLEMLDPVYSEKAVFQDGTIRIAFDASYTDEGLESRIPFWIHNVSGDVINILWDRCSIQLPNGNTVKVLSEESLTYFGAPGGTISIASSGDLFDAVIPVSEFVWEEDPGWSVSTGVLDAGTFTFVLAIECGEARPAKIMPGRGQQMIEEDCDDGKGPLPFGKTIELPSEGRNVVYYTFRFVVR
ncbi:MAG: hypothetical protein WBC63_06640 [Candidatus Bipolaricaulia bacterium]